MEEEVPCSANGEDPESGALDAAAAIMAADSLLNPEQQSSADNGRGTPGKPAEQPTPATPHSTDEPRAGDASAGDSGTGEGDATGAVEAAAKVADVNLTRTKVVRREIPPPPPPQQVVIGRRAQDALLDGQQLSDSDTAALVADAIEKLQEGYTAWRAATDDSGAPAVDDNGKPTHPQVIFARLSSLEHRSRRKHHLNTCTQCITLVLLAHTGSLYGAADHHHLRRLWCEEALLPRSPLDMAIFFVSARRSHSCMYYS